jgi:hypothetical protein
MVTSRAAHQIYQRLAIPTPSISTRPPNSLQIPSPAPSPVRIQRIITPKLHATRYATPERVHDANGDHHVAAAAGVSPSSRVKRSLDMELAAAATTTTPSNRQPNHTTDTNGGNDMDGTILVPTNANGTTVSVVASLPGTLDATNDHSDTACAPLFHLPITSAPAVETSITPQLGRATSVASAGTATATVPTLPHGDNSLHTLPSPVSHQLFAKDTPVRTNHDDEHKIKVAPPNDEAINSLPSPHPPTVPSSSFQMAVSTLSLSPANEQQSPNEHHALLAPISTNDTPSTSPIALADRTAVTAPINIEGLHTIVNKGDSCSINGSSNGNNNGNNMGTSDSAAYAEQQYQRQHQYRVRGLVIRQPSSKAVVRAVPASPNAEEGKQHAAFRPLQPTAIALRYRIIRFGVGSVFFSLSWYTTRPHLHCS